MTNKVLKSKAIKYLMPTAKAENILVKQGKVLFEGKEYFDKALLPYNDSRVDINGYNDSILIMTKDGMFITKLKKKTLSSNDVILENKLKQIVKNCEIPDKLYIDNPMGGDNHL